MLAYIFSFIDRQILALLVQPIRRDLGISDTQMSLLMGFSFAVFYSFFGILLGRLADSRSRRTIIVIGFSLWSLMTTGCGLTRNFVQMLLLRMGVGVGEASLSPRPTRSLPITSHRTDGRRRSASIRWASTSAQAWLSCWAEPCWASPLPSRCGLCRWSVQYSPGEWPFRQRSAGITLALLVYTVREPARRGLRLVIAADGTLKSSAGADARGSRLHP